MSIRSRVLSACHVAAASSCHCTFHSCVVSYLVEGLLVGDVGQPPSPMLKERGGSGDGHSSLVGVGLVVGLFGVCPTMG